ncbi:hypothetical protein [Myroides odoratimimus]|uniref:hypothetical protein n=1 Tax=Myroides odoratimimus TaxID=76832 RepID=UPI002578B5A8|nr:hypothetical protein [Myroides odoratimimus]
MRHDEQLPAVMSAEELRKEVLLGVEEVRSGYGIKQKDFFEEMVEVIWSKIAIQE